eukprot:TRINITY_DN3468_c0_g1_i2.p1 TRINITY_DN3468_c0_g1~~TRINITY_DN3468_c0_g1_i2.p1  ORF type:complete len:195 (+),score=21.44 TRINITY_DN3468_c0_g1_i2:306-890(+)
MFEGAVGILLGILHPHYCTEYEKWLSAIEERSSKKRGKGSSKKFGSASGRSKTKKTVPEIPWINRHPHHGSPRNSDSSPRGLSEPLSHWSTQSLRSESEEEEHRGRRLSFGPIPKKSLSLRDQLSGRRSSDYSDVAENGEGRKKKFITRQESLSITHSVGDSVGTNNSKNNMQQHQQQKKKKKKKKYSALIPLL